MQRSRGAMGRDQRRRLARESVRVGDGRIAGRLYDLGAYPGLVLSSDLHEGAATLPVRTRAEVVRGEIVRLSCARDTFAWLDLYEGIVPGEPDPPYERTVGGVLTTRWGRLSAWVYAYRGRISAARRVPGGDWLR